MFRTVNETSIIVRHMSWVSLLFDLVAGNNSKSSTIFDLHGEADALDDGEENTRTHASSLRTPRALTDKFY